MAPWIWTRCSALSTERLEFTYVMYIIYMGVSLNGGFPPKMDGL